MMTLMELSADRLARSLEFVKMTLADFTEADMFARPTAGANHAAWQIGHLTSAEARMVAGATGNPPALPAGFAERFTRATASSDDPAAFPKMAELMETFTAVRNASVAWARALKPDQLELPGPEQIRMLAPTIGHLPALMAEHTAMHVGQFQVLRRKLGKPVLF